MGICNFWDFLLTIQHTWKKLVITKEIKFSEQRKRQIRFFQELKDNNVYHEDLQMLDGTYCNSFLQAVAYHFNCDIRIYGVKTSQYYQWRSKQEALFQIGKFFISSQYVKNGF